MKALYTLFIILIAAIVLPGCSKSSQPPPQASAQLQGLPAIQQAVKDYNTKEGHFPKSLDDLVPTYLAKIPDAPGGYKFVYDSGTGTVSMARN